MSFLHCHSCNWSQDDFWSFKWGKYGYWKLPLLKLGWAYNPVSCFLSRIKGYLWPRRIKHDKWWADEMGWKRSDPYSWFLVWWQFKRMIRKFKRQKWWTYQDWKKDSETAVCPKCGAHNFDID